MQIKNISSKGNISLDNICYLVELDYQNDADGNQIPTKTQRLCYCAELPVYLSEFANAGQAGIKAEKVLMIVNENYNGEKQVDYNDMEFSVYRVFQNDNGFLELYLTHKVGDL